MLLPLISVEGADAVHLGARLPPAITTNATVVVAVEVRGAMGTPLLELVQSAPGVLPSVDVKLAVHGF